MASYKIVWNGLTMHRLAFENYPIDDQDLKIIKFQFQIPNHKGQIYTSASKKEDLGILVYLKFKNDSIEDSFFEIDDPDYALIPKLIKNFRSQASSNLISAIDNTLFHISIISTIKIQNSVNAVSDWIVTMNSEIKQYISQLNTEYAIYLNNPHDWIMKNAPNKKDSLFLIWKINKNCRMVFIDLNEFQRITDCDYYENFVPFTIMILNEENDKYEIRLISQESQEKLNYNSYLVSYLTSVGEVLENFESWIQIGSIDKNPNYFIEGVKESRKIDLFLKSSN